MISASFLPPGLVMALCLAVSTSAVAQDQATMPQTKGMQNMDPALHEKWAKEEPQDPYKHCTPNARKAAQQDKHPMPQTKGMQGMDPKAHTVDCPQELGISDGPNAPPKHVHKQ